MVKMSNDRYVKLILTVIAISLTVIALRPCFAPTVAGAAGFEGCGQDAVHPCYVAGWGPEGTIPVANSGRFPLKVLVANPAVSVVVANGPLLMGQP
jgi:hypothetical protein